MASAADLQNLLRFLSQDAKVPLATAMAKVKLLQAANLGTAELLSKSDAKALQPLFEDEKLAKQVLSAAKRFSKKRGAGDGDAAPASPAKRRFTTVAGEILTPAAMEASLALPEPVKDVEVLSQVSLVTNRAPLVLAFAVALLKYTMPEQPLSSRLSLAQAVVSVNSRTKAVSLGLESGKSAEEEGWGEGQPEVKVMGRAFRVMKRWGYDPYEGDHVEKSQASDTMMVAGERMAESGDAEMEPALWGIDLEALKKSNANGLHSGQGPGLPIYTAQSARAYLMKSFASPAVPTSSEEKSKAKKQNNAAVIAEKEKNVGYLMGALELLLESWASTLDEAELNRRAWGWYVRVRPDVDSGVSGWGAKGAVKLSDILELRRTS